MSDESQVFRGDRDPEISKGGDASAKQKAAALQEGSAPVPAPAPKAAASFNDEPAPKAAASFNNEPVPEAPAETPPPAATTAPAPAAPEAELTFEVDRSQLWQASEAMIQRMSQLRSTAVETGQMLDEHEAEARRLEKQLKSL